MQRAALAVEKAERKKKEVKRERKKLDVRSEGILLRDRGIADRPPPPRKSITNYPRGARRLNPPLCRSRWSGITERRATKLRAAITANFLSERCLARAKLVSFV